MSVDPARQDLRRALFAALDETRAHGRDVPAAEILKLAVSHGAPPTWPTLLELGAIHRNWAPSPAEHLIEFVAAYAATRNARSILDPEALQPAWLAGLVDLARPETATGIVERSEIADAAKLVNSSIDWRVSDAVEGLSELEVSFDLVTSAPAVGRTGALPAGLDDWGSNWYRQERAHLLLVLASRLLTDEGTMVFLLREGFNWGRDAHRTKEILESLGVYVSAVISTPNGDTSHGVPTNLVFFSRSPTGEDLFVGQLVDGGGKELLQNLLQRAEGAEPSLGRLVKPAEYIGWASFSARHRIRRIAEQGPYRLVELGDIASQVSRCRITEDEEFAGAPNAIYLPETGLGPVAVATPVQEGRAARNFVEVVLDTERAQAQWVGAWLNTSTGRMARQTVLSGNVLGRTSTQAAYAIPIILPPIDAQAQAVQLSDRVETLRLELDRLQQDLWGSEPDLTQLGRALGRLGQDDSLEGWIDRMPFPLASILYRYLADASPNVRVNRLLDFYEACAEFLATVMLSALHSDEVLFEDVRPRLARPDPKGNHPLQLPTFGTWVHIGQTLAKAVRRFLGDENREVCLRSFAVTDPSLAESLAHKQLWAILTEMLVERNDSAHGGIESDASTRRTLERLESALVRLRQAIGPVFDGVDLIEPGSSAYERGVHHYGAAKRLRGPNPIFREVHVESFEALERSSLYFVDHERPAPVKALRILPFFQLQPQPETEENACYFYNSAGSDGSLGFKSYHFAGAPETRRLDPDLSEILAELAPDSA